MAMVPKILYERTETKTLIFGVSYIMQMVARTACLYFPDASLLKRKIIPLVKRYLFLELVSIYYGCCQYFIGLFEHSSGCYCNLVFVCDVYIRESYVSLWIWHVMHVINWIDSSHKRCIVVLMFNNLTRKLQISQLLIHTQQSKQLKNGLIWSADPQNIIQYDTQKTVPANY